MQIDHYLGYEEHFQTSVRTLGYILHWICCQFYKGYQNRQMIFARLCSLICDTIVLFAYATGAFVT